MAAFATEYKNYLAKRPDIALTEKELAAAKT